MAACIPILLSALAIVGLADGFPSLAIAFGTSIVLTLHTFRRIHDAGHSRWWATLIFFPLSINYHIADSEIVLDFGRLSVFIFKSNQLDVAELIKLIPCIMAAVLPSAEPITSDPSVARGHNLDMPLQSDDNLT